MSGMKGRSGGKRKGAGAKPKGSLSGLRALANAHVSATDWASIFDAMVAKAKRGNVSAFRELRGAQFGQIPLATDPSEDPADHGPYVIEMPCMRRHVDDDDPNEAPVPPTPPPQSRP